jgi:hypothetical protein
MWTGASQFRFRSSKDSSDPVQGQSLGLGSTLLVAIKRDSGRCVPKQFLNGLDAFALLTQKTGERVSKSMPSHSFRNASRDGGRFDVILQR